MRLWKKEKAAHLLRKWELHLQGRITTALASLLDGGSEQFDVDHPLPDQLAPNLRRLATVAVDVTQIREPGYVADEVVVIIDPAARWAGSAAFWRLATRILTTIHSPEQEWDRYRSTYSTILEAGSLTSRLQSLEARVASSVLAESTAGTQSHRVHKRMLTKRIVEGQATQALCGVYFVPRQDHEALRECELCAERMQQIDTFSS